MNAVNEHFQYLVLALEKREKTHYAFEDTEITDEAAEGEAIALLDVITELEATDESEELDPIVEDGMLESLVITADELAIAALEIVLLDGWML